jgi:PAP2 superfamily protein
VFGLLMVVGALTRPVRRRQVACAAALAYTLVALGAGTLKTSFWVNVCAPGALLLMGYWLSGMLFHAPQLWLEAWLLEVDRALGADRWAVRLPRVALEALEACYAGVYPVVAGGAIFAATKGLDAVAHYWTLVLTATLLSYAPLPWLRSRPPRVTERGTPVTISEARSGNTNGRSRPRVRRLNALILDNASIQANTLPSGHVSGAVAAAMAVMALDGTAGWALMAAALMIAVAAIAGRYHYTVDCLAGGAVAALVFVFV